MEILVSTEHLASLFNKVASSASAYQDGKDRSAILIQMTVLKSLVCWALTVLI